MTTILPAERTPFDVIGRDVGQSLQGILPQAIEKRQGLNAINELQSALENSGGDISKMLPAIARAYSLNPNLQRSGIAEHYLNMAKSINSQKVPLPGEREDMPKAPVRQELPGFMGKLGNAESQFFPTNVGPQGDVGNVPQAATAGKKEPLLDYNGQTKAARKLSAERTAAGIPTNVKDALAEVKEAEEAKKAYNQKIDEELAQRVEGQETYGKRAVDYLNGVYPNASPEMQAAFMKKGEDASTKGMSEAEINRYLANEAKNFKNSIANVKKEISAPRLYNSIHRAATGTYKNFEKAAADVRQHLKPLLDLGLYDEARNILTEQGYAPEERDMIINPISERGKTSLNKVPTLPSPKRVPFIHGVAVKTEKPNIKLQDIKDGLMDLQESDSNFSLPLARKAFEDKGYDWRSFKDALNEMQQEGFKLSSDQGNQLGILDSPPLNVLEEILHSLNLVGR